jgi:biotin carboxylase
LDRIALVMHTTSYGAAGFVRACRRAGSDVMIASDRCHVLDGAWQWPADSLVIDFADPEGAAEIIASAARRSGPALAAVLPVGGEHPARVAALAAGRLGLSANPPDAMIAAANKLEMRTRLAAAHANQPEQPDLRQPRFAVVARTADPRQVADLVRAPGGVGFPCVVKPLMLSGSRGVLRADDPATLTAALGRLGRLLADPAVRHVDPIAADRILLESFIPGREVAVEGLLTRGALDVLAIFDKPDPLDGPTFEETIYVTPSRLPPEEQRLIARATAAATRALGLETGAVHAELRLDGGVPVVIEVAARPIGGLCARSLRFAGDLTLEDVVVRHALGAPERPPRQRRPSGVMMIPIPTREPAVLRSVGRLEDARAVPFVDDVVISVRPGETVVPLPEGASYLGFIFASAETPAEVESALRAAAGRLRFDLAPLVPVVRG